MSPANIDPSRERRQVLVYLALTQIVVVLAVCDILSDIFLHARSVDVKAAGASQPMWFDWDFTFSIAGLIWIWLSVGIWRRR